MKLPLTLLALLAATSAHAGDWTWHTPPPAEYAYQALNLVDMGQTLDIRDHPNLQEANPFLGRHPSDAAVIGFKAGSGAAHLLVTEWLLNHGATKRQMWVYEIVSTAIQGAVVGHNFSLGVGVRF